MSPVEDTAHQLLVLTSLDTKTKSELKKLSKSSSNKSADGDSDEDEEDDDDEDDYEDKGSDDDDDDDDDDNDGLIQQLKSSAADAPGGADMQSGIEDEDHPIGMINELVEGFEESHSSDANCSASELAKRATAKCFHPEEADADADDTDQWVSDQKGETLEQARERIETEIASRALASGAKIRGPALLTIAEEHIAEPWLRLVYPFCGGRTKAS